MKKIAFFMSCVLIVLAFPCNNGFAYSAEQTSTKLEVKSDTNNKPQSNIISHLKAKIETGDSNALKEFWNDIQKKVSPLIEEIPGDDKNCLVTYIYKGDANTKNVLVIPGDDRHAYEDKNYVNDKMERLLDTNLWYLSIETRNDIRYRYKYSVNDLLDGDIKKREENLTNDPLNKNKVVYGNFEDSYAVMPKAIKYVWTVKRDKVLKGQLKEYNYQNDKLVNKERKLWVYTPNGYSEKNKPYGFLLLTDGQDYINTLSAVNVLDNLIEDKKIPPIVVIFVETSKNRGKEMMCSEIFSDALAKDIVPWVRNKYKITNKPSEAIIGGLSLGGLNASYTGLKHSEVFGNVLSESGSYWYNTEDDQMNNCWLAGQFKAAKKLPLKFYFNVGICEADMIIHNRSMSDAIKQKGYSVYYEEFKSGHDYLSWGEMLANGLISLIGKK